MDNFRNWLHLDYYFTIEKTLLFCSFFNRGTRLFWKTNFVKFRLWSNEPSNKINCYFRVSFLSFQIQRSWKEWNILTREELIAKQWNLNCWQVQGLHTCPKSIINRTNDYLERVRIGSIKEDKSYIRSWRFSNCYTFFEIIIIKSDTWKRLILNRKIYSKLSVLILRNMPIMLIMLLRMFSYFFNNSSIFCFYLSIYLMQQLLKK